MTLCCLLGYKNTIMKKLFICLFPLLAQGATAEQISNEQNFQVETLLPVLLIGILFYFLISLIKFALEYRLKNKMIEKGLTEHLSHNLFASNNKKDDAIKAAILLSGIGLGLLLSYFTAPLHIHSLAIMAFSIAGSYWAYFLYLKRSN